MTRTYSLDHGPYRKRQGTSVMINGNWYKRRFSELAREASCNQEDACALQQRLDDEAEPVIAQGQALVLKHPSVAALDGPAPLAQSRSGWLASPVDLGCDTEEAAQIDRVAGISGRTQWSSPRLGSGDADRLRLSQLQHAVQDHDGDVHLCGLTLVRARAQPVADHPFEAADRCLGQGTAIVAGGILPARAAVLGDQLQ